MNLPKKLIIKKFSSEILVDKWDLIVIAVSSVGIDSMRESLNKLEGNCPVLILTKGLKYDRNKKKIITMSEQLNKGKNKFDISVLKGPC